MQMPSEVCAPYGSPIYHSPVIFIIASLPVVVLNINISYKTNQYVPKKHMACPPYCIGCVQATSFLAICSRDLGRICWPFFAARFFGIPGLSADPQPPVNTALLIFFAPVPYRDAGLERRELKFCAWLRAGVGHLYNSAPLLAPGAVAREAEFVSVERKAGWTEQQHTHNQPGVLSSLQFLFVHRRKREQRLKSSEGAVAAARGAATRSAARGGSRGGGSASLIHARR